jgi:hypothetical protein
LGTWRRHIDAADATQVLEARAAMTRLNAEKLSMAGTGIPFF